MVAVGVLTAMVTDCRALPLHTQRSGIPGHEVTMA